MENKKIIGYGAEAIITLDKNQVTKNRIKKSYRIQVLDERLRRQRTRSEAKIINKLSEIIPVPRIIKTDEKQEIIMDYIEGKKLSENIETLDWKSVCEQIGKNIALMHNQNIIHGDLTTSNMIFVENLKNECKTESSNNRSINNNYPNDYNLTTNINNKKSSSKRTKLACEKDINQDQKDFTIYLIDFGLSFHSERIEDKAVDLHLLQQALEAKHFTIWQQAFKIILQNYEKNAKKGKEILHRIKVIESRGRYKDKF